MARLARKQDRVLGKSRGSDVGLLCRLARNRAVDREEICILRGNRKFSVGPGVKIGIPVNLGQ